MPYSGASSTLQSTQNLTTANRQLVRFKPGHLASLQRCLYNLHALALRASAYNLVAVFSWEIVTSYSIVIVDDYTWRRLSYLENDGFLEEFCPTFREELL